MQISDSFTHYVTIMQASRMYIEGVGLHSCTTQGNKYLFEARVSGCQTRDQLPGVGLLGSVDI